VSGELADIRRTAYHEAGHAVVNLIYGLPFQTISLKTEQRLAYQIEDGRKVSVMLTYSIGIVFPEARLDLVNKTLMAGILDIKEALSLLGGPVAEHMFVGKNDGQTQVGARQDVQAIACCCRAAMSASSRLEDWKEFPQMEDYMLAAIAAGAESLIKENWASVKAIAESLIEKEELDYPEISKIAEASGLLRRG